MLTHAHEDHIGALGLAVGHDQGAGLATPFTAFLLREKLREAGV